MTLRESLSQTTTESDLVESRDGSLDAIYQIPQVVPDPSESETRHKADTMEHPTSSVQVEVSTLPETPHYGYSYRRMLPPTTELLVHFNARQKWVGRVLYSKGQVFVAELVDPGRPNSVQEAEIPLEEIGLDDRDRVEPGAVFYWSIGYLEQPSGRSRHSEILFRRLPPWTRSEIGSAQSKSLDRDSGPHAG